jgi:tetratricopeptide (TPR) repeat protein
MERSDEQAVNAPSRWRGWILWAIIALVLIIAVWIIFGAMRAGAQRSALPDRPDPAAMAPAVSEQIIDAFVKAEASPGDAGVVGRLAMILHANGYDEESRVAYAAARRLDPDDFRWPYLLAVQMIGLGQNDAALPLLEQAVDIDPGAAHAWTRLGELRSARGKVDDATMCFNKAIAIEPAHSHALLGLARIAGRNGAWEEVVELLAPAVKENPNFGSGAGYLAAALRNLNRDAEAVRYEYRGADTGFQMADPVLDAVFDLSSNGDILLIQAKTAELGGDGARAMALLKRGVRVAPDLKDLRLALGDLHTKRAEENPGDQEPVTLAIEQYEAGLKIDPAYDRMRNGLAYAKVLKGELIEAMRIWRELIAEEPDHAIAMANIGQLHLRRGEFDTALQLLERALEIPPIRPSA